MLTKLKKRIETSIVYQAKVAFKAGLTPNQISSLGIMFALASGISYWLAGTSYWQYFLVLAPIFLLVSGFCDALDGALARLYGETTSFGGFLDSLLDRYAESAVYLGLILGGFADQSWGIVALIGSLLVSYARARSEVEGIKMETIGIAERAERLLIIIFGSLIGLIWREALRWCVILLALLTHLTVLQRAVYLYRKTR